MAPRISDDLRALLDRQCGVLSRAQAVRGGLPPTLIDSQLRCGHWQRLQQGVYATFTGSLSRDAILWAAVLRAGPVAALSHRTAAELHGLVSQPSSLIHVTLPKSYRTKPISGVIMHHTRLFYVVVHPSFSPPRVRVEHTALDLTESCQDSDDAFTWLCRAVGRGLTTPELLRQAIDQRTRVRWRDDILGALDEIADGVRSPLERRYVHNVELPHGLPEAERQARTLIDGRSRYVDNLYRQAGLAVELDGRAAHPPEQRWADSHRDNAHAILGILTLRYNWLDITTRPCEVAAEVGALLAMRGQAVLLRRCGPTCPVLAVSGR